MYSSSKAFAFTTAYYSKVIRTKKAFGSDATLAGFVLGDTKSSNKQEFVTNVT